MGILIAVAIIEVSYFILRHTLYPLVEHRRQRAVRRLPHARPQDARAWAEWWASRAAPQWLTLFLTGVVAVGVSPCTYTGLLFVGWLFLRQWKLMREAFVCGTY